MTRSVEASTALQDYRQIFDVLPAPHLVLASNDPEFTILSANQAMLQATNMGDDIIGKPLFEVFPENPDAEESSTSAFELAAALRQVIQTKKAHKLSDIKYDIPTKDGKFEERWWQPLSTPLLGEDGEVKAIIHTVIDITQQVLHEDEVRKAKRNEEIASARIQQMLDIRESFDFLQQVIDKSQTGIFLFTPVKGNGGTVQDFVFKLANDKLSSYIGKTKEEVIGGLGSQLFPGYKTNGLFELYRDTYDTGKQNHFEFHYDSDGIDVWLDIVSTKLGDEVLVTFSDYTTLKHLQQEHESIIDELRRSNNDLEQFAYIASHDLQEPLRKIQAFGDILRNRYDAQLGEEGSGLIERMQNASDRMKTLIEDLLTYSRVSTQKRQFKQVDLNKVLGEVMFDLETSIREKNAVIMLPELLPVIGDEIQLRQLFLNLLSNALKFNKQDQQPRITITSRRTKGSDALNVILPDLRSTYQHITIADEGIGFEQEYAERIFQIFQRLHGRTDYPGTGVGLSIVRKVVDQHKGAIRAEGIPDKGSIFHLYLPIEKV